MNFLSRLAEKMQIWMNGRNGADQLGIASLLTGLVLSLVGSFTRLGLVSFLGFGLYIWTLFRMFSRNLEGRRKENRKYIELTGNASLKAQQFVRRQKNRKEYKYFRCPQCKQLLRLKRGCGEKQITCAKCGHQFTEKA